MRIRVPQVVNTRPKLKVGSRQITIPLATWSQEQGLK